MPSQNTSQKTEPSGEFDDLRSILLFDELVSFAQLGDYGLFLPNAAKQTEIFLSWRPHELVNPILFHRRRSANRILDAWRPDKPADDIKSDCRVYLSKILAQLDAAKMSFGCLDVGGYLGLFSIFFGTLAMQRGASTRIRCYEPGPTQNLIERNAEINGIANIFELRRAAVSDLSGPILYEYEAGRTLSGGLSLNETNKTYSRIIQSTTLDDEIENGFSDLDCIIMKIDVEGFEAESFRGLQKHRRKVPIIISEIQPWAKNKRVGERTFQEMMRDDYYLIDIGNSMWPHDYIAMEGKDMDEWYEEIKLRKGGMTDLIMISKDFPLAKAIYDELIALDPFDKSGLAAPSK